MLGVTREGFRKYLLNRDKPWKYEHIVELIKEILNEDEYNDMYGRIRMYEALINKYPSEKIPCEHTINKIMQIAHINNHLRKPKGITESDPNAKPAENLFKRNFKADKPYDKCVTDITEVPAKDGKLYVSGLFDCYSLRILGLEMRDNMKADLCIQTIKNAYMLNPKLKGCKIHSDRGRQYTSEPYVNNLMALGLIQSMNSAGGRCHDNAKCESMWSRMKVELFYERYDTRKMTKEELKKLIWRYYMSYWNNRRICTANGGLPPILKEQQYYDSIANKDKQYDLYVI